MKRSYLKLSKKLVAVMLILVLCVENFAAVVSDNDGSAFITKAEFDSLKNNFQTQIDMYNTSIDAKIDNAIAAYLAGITVTTKENVKTYVENYKDLYWCHDFSIEAKEKKWTSRTAFTIAEEKTLQPNYERQNGWAYWPKDRGIRFPVILPTNFGLAGFACRGAFLSDSAYTKTSTNDPNYNDGYMATILMMKVVGDSVIDTNPLIQYGSTNYNMFRWGLDWQSWLSMSISQHAGGGGQIKIEGIPASSDDEYFRIKLTGLGGLGDNEWHEQVWTTSNTYAFSPLCWEFGTLEPGRNKTQLEAENITFPIYSYFCSASARTSENQTRLYNMMLGTVSSYRLPYLYDYREGGPNGQITTGYETSAGATRYSFADYSKWAKRSITTTLTLSPIFGTAQNIGNVTETPVLNTSSMVVNIPVVTRGYVRDLRSPVATYNGENLKICGGIPILIDALKKGKLIVKIKCNKNYDNATKGAVGNTDAHIKFKKTDYMDSKTNYVSGTYGDDVKATFDGSQTLNISDETFKLDVEKGDDVWLNIDPITLGQHIKITDLQCTLEYE